MNRLFPLPLYSFFKIVKESGGVSTKGLKNVTPWLIKTTLFEPLRWIELATQQKKVLQHAIQKDPVFILGFYRSGTSYLHEFLTMDDRLGYHTVYQMVLPEIMLTAEKWMSPVFQSVSRLCKLQDPVHRIPLNWKYPGEEDATMTALLNPMGAQWGYVFPEKMQAHFRKYVLFENIPAQELEAWKQEFVLLIKKISLANQGRQLVLKSPPNTARIKLLLSLFPRAKFIFIHRNPYEVFRSNQQFWKVTQDIYAIGSAKAVDINAIILDTYAAMMHRYQSEKHLVPEGQLVEIPYEDLIHQPLESMRKIYSAIHLDAFGYCENNMKSFALRQHSYVRLKHEIPAVERNLVAAKLEPFFRLWNYPL